ncbi:MAG TPA: hypothetical protein VGR31_03170 [Planctomycetota bacterium]|jgi:hypothetical protein|nr:hypothetical protein [Planctomycetota bacterium]
MKFLLRALVVLLVLGVVGVAGAWLFLNPIVSSAIEKGSTYATGVDTKVGSVDASLLSGRFGLKELSLANPPGFRPEPFVHLASAQAAWQNGTILSKTIQMDEFVVDGVDVNLERTGSGTNYGTILDHLGKISGGDKGKPTESAGGKTLLIKKIEIRNVRAGLHLSGVPLASGSLEVKVPSIVINDFRSDGSTTEIVSKLTRVLLQSILERVLAAGKDIFPADIVKDLGNGLKGVGSTLEDSAKSALDETLKGVGDIFKKKK